MWLPKPVVGSCTDVCGHLFWIVGCCLQYLDTVPPSSQVDCMRAIMIVWRLRANSIRRFSAVCVVYSNCAQWYAHMWTFLQLTVTFGLVLRFFFVFLACFCTFRVTHTQLFYSSMDFVRDNPGEQVREETFTHSHLLWSPIIPYLLLPSNTIHGIPPVQSWQSFPTIYLQVPSYFPFSQARSHILC